MIDLDDARTTEYLLRATPTQVFDWMQSQPRRKPSAGLHSSSSVPAAAEISLVSRCDELIDLALASWGNCDEALKQIYLRRCGRSAVATWPPDEGTYAYTILLSLLANDWIRMSPWKLGDFSSVCVLPAADIEWLIEFGDTECLRAIHRNFGMAIGLLCSCSSRFGPYGRMNDDQWLRCIALLGSNEALHVEEDSNDGGPDTLHWDIHKAFVEAAIVCPKTPVGAIVLGKLFQNLPTKASANTHIDRDLLIRAVDSWNAPISADDEDAQRGFLIGPEYDGLGLGERIQFHLLRHYEHCWNIDPDDDSRIKRLCAYAISPVNAGAPVLTNDAVGRGLHIDRIADYSAKDGPAFIYASSFNKYIWGNPHCSELFNKRTWSFDGHMNSTNLDMPSDSYYILSNREEIEKEAQRERIESEAEAEPLQSLDERTISIDNRVAELSTRVSNLELQIRSVRSAVVWVGALVTLVLLIFR